jgi:serine/threonine protein kinase
MSIARLEKYWPQWQIGEVLGEGSFGKVYKALRDEHGFATHSAIKVISIPQNDAEVSSLRAEGWNEASTKTYLQGIVDDFVNEIKLMETLKGTQNIVGVEDYLVLEKEDKIGWDIFIRMELLTSFNDYMEDKELTEKDVIKIGLDILNALVLCSKKNIIHRDIKPENIFVSSFGYYKLGDFGIARELDKTSGDMSQKGTFNYIAPEVITERTYDGTVDIYSLGVVLFKLLNNNKLPFIDQTTEAIRYQDRKNAVERRLKGEPLHPPVGASRMMAQAILKACSFNPKDRYQTPEEFIQALERVNSGEEEVDLSSTVLHIHEAVDMGFAPAPQVQAQTQTSGVAAAPDVSHYGNSNGVNPANTFGDAPKTKDWQKPLYVSLGTVAAFILFYIIFINNKNAVTHASLFFSTAAVGLNFLFYQSIKLKNPIITLSKSTSDLALILLYDGTFLLLLFIGIWWPARFAAVYILLHVILVIMLFVLQATLGRLTVAVAKKSEEVQRIVSRWDNIITDMQFLQEKLIMDSSGRWKASQKAMDNLCEEIRFSDPVSNSAVSGIEAQFEVLINNLRGIIASPASNENDEQLNALLEQMKALLQHRNRVLRVKKG